MPKHDLRGDIRDWGAGRFSKEWDGSRGTWIDFDDRDIAIWLDDELDVEETNHIKGQADLDRILDDGLLDFLAEGIRRIDGHRVARMHAGALNELHDAWDKDIFAVAYGIDFGLNAHDVFVD